MMMMAQGPKRGHQISKEEHLNLNLDLNCNLNLNLNLELGLELGLAPAKEKHLADANVYR